MSAFKAGTAKSGVPINMILAGKTISFLKKADSGYNNITCIGWQFLHDFLKNYRLD